MFAFKKLRLRHSIPAQLADLDTEQDHVWEQLDGYVRDQVPTAGLLTLLRGESSPDEKTLIFRATRPAVIAVLAEAMADRGLCGYVLTGDAELSQQEVQALVGAGLVPLPDAGQPLGGLSLAELRKILDASVDRAQTLSGFRVPAVFIPQGDVPYDGLTLRVTAQLGLNVFAPHRWLEGPRVFGYSQ